MATTPTLISTSGNTWTTTTGTARTTGSVSWVAGDVIIVVGITEDNTTATLGTPTGTGLSFTLVTSTNTASTCKAYVWQAKPIASGSSTINSTASGALMANIQAYVYRSSAGVGATAAVVTGTALTNSLTRTYDNSAVLWVAGDYGAGVLGTTVASPTGTVDQAARVAGSATHFAVHYGNQGTAGATSYGISGFTSAGVLTKIAIEVLPNLPRFLQGTTASDGTTGTATTAAITTTAGNFMVVTVANDSALTTSITAVSDSKGNSYTRTQTPVANTATVEMWYARIATGGSSHTVSATWNTGNTTRCVVLAQEFAGFDGTPTLDKTSSTTGTSTTASGGTTATTTQAIELVVAGFVHGSTTSAFTLGTGYTNLTTVNVANAAAAQESKQVSATAAMTGTATIAASRDWAGMLATFYDAPAGASPYTKGNFFAFF